MNRPMKNQIRDWFLANPGEILTYQDIAARFNMTQHQARCAVRALRREGLLDSAVMVFKVPGGGE